MNRIPALRSLSVSIILPFFFLLFLLGRLQANGQFEDSGQRLGGDLTFDVDSADLDGDGDPDVFTANNLGNRVWINQGADQNGDAGFFLNSGQSPGLLESRGVALGNVDNAGGVDAFVVNDGEREVWLNNGSANFSLDQQLPSDNSDGQDVALGLLDDDSSLDAFVVNKGPNEVWLNDGSGDFSLGQDALANATSREVALGDLDGDGTLDAYVANGDTGAQEDEIWWNNGQGFFSADSQTLDFDWNEGVALGDLDGDDDQDIFLAAWFGFDSVWINQGGAQNGTEGVFSDSGQNLSGSSSTDVALVDVEDDGDLDAVVAKWLLPNEVWINNGQGQFTKNSQELDASATYEVRVDDLDQDGDPDLFFGNSGTDQVWLMGGFGLPGAFFDVQSRGNPAGQEVYPWAQEGDAQLPVVLSFPAPEDLLLQVQIEASTPYMSDVIVYPLPSGQSRLDIELQNPGISPSSSLTLNLSTQPDANGRLATTDRVNPLNLLFVDPEQGPIDCVLCISDWILKMAGFEPSFWMLHHFELQEIFNSVSGDYYTAVFQGNEAELTTIILKNPGILWQTYDVLQVWTPVVGAYDAGEGEQVLLTQEMVDGAGELLQSLADESGPSMARTVEREWAYLESGTLPGKNADQAVDRLIDRVTNQVFLPLTTSPD